MRVGAWKWDSTSDTCQIKLNHMSPPARTHAKHSAGQRRRACISASLSTGQTTWVGEDSCFCLIRWKHHDIDYFISDSSVSLLTRKGFSYVLMPVSLHFGFGDFRWISYQYSIYINLKKKTRKLGLWHMIFFPFITHQVYQIRRYIVQIIQPSAKT